MLSKRSVSYNFAKNVKAFFCCPCNFTCGAICLILSCDEKTSPKTYYTDRNVKTFDDATDYFCGCNDDKLTVRCRVIANAVDAIITEYKKQNHVSSNFMNDLLEGNDVANMVTPILWNIFNQYYVKNDDILDTNNKDENQVRKLQLLGNQLGLQIIAKLPVDLATTARMAGVNPHDELSYKTFFNTCLKDFLTERLVMDLLPSCYNGRNQELLREQKNHDRESFKVQLAAQAAHQANHLFAQPQISLAHSYSENREQKVAPSLAVMS